tara:strand:+ start:4388 stop:5005 length:618 start_codon:yes stop_codon:yes gene_type:complete
MWPLIAATIYSLSYFIYVEKEFSIWLSILTHAFALPVIVEDFPNFLSISTCLTVIASTLFHIINDLYNDDKEKHFRRFDHGWSVFLIYAILFKVSYKKIPEWAIFVLTMVTVIPAAFLTNPRTYLPLAILAFIIMLSLLYRKYNRQLLIAFILFVTAAASRYIPILDNKYHRHSVWHALIFTAVYYAHLGIVYNETKKRSKNLIS